MLKVQTAILKKLNTVENHTQKAIDQKVIETAPLQMKVLQKLNATEAQSAAPLNWMDIYWGKEPGPALIYAEETKRQGIQIEQPKILSSAVRAESYKVIQKALPLIYKKDLNSEEIESNRSILENPGINTWKHDFSACTHNIWFTNTIDYSKSRDIILPYHPNGIEGTFSDRAALHTVGAIDSADSVYRMSMANLDAAFEEANKPLTHIIWTNLDVDTFPFPEKIPNLRKVCGFEPITSPMPDFIVINYRTGRIINEKVLKPRELLTSKALKNDIAEAVDYLNSIKLGDGHNTIMDMVRQVVLRMGGLYFDFDYVFFDQKRLHERGKLNICDLVKNYDSVFMSVGTDRNAVVHHDLILFNKNHIVNKANCETIRATFNNDSNKYSDEIGYLIAGMPLIIGPALCDALKPMIIEAKQNHAESELIAHLKSNGASKLVIDLANDFLKLPLDSFLTNDIALPAPILIQTHPDPSVQSRLNSEGFLEMDHFFEPIGAGIFIGSWA